MSSAFGAGNFPFAAFGAGAKLAPEPRMALTLYFLRHGQTQMSRENVFCGSGLNPELTSEGEEMARAFAQAFRSKSWQAIYCSPLRRAVATATPLAEMTNVELNLRDELQEIAYGAWEGKTVEWASQNFHDEHLKWTADPAWNAPPGGETAVAVARRASRVVEEIQEKFADGNVLIVSHKATIRVALCSLLGVDVGRFRFRLACPVGSVSIVEFGRNGPLLQALAHRAHLSERLRDLPGT